MKADSSGTSEASGPASEAAGNGASTGGTPGRDAATAAARLALEVARAQEGRLAFLARASMALGTSLDSAATADHVAHLAVPELADLCIIDLTGRAPYRTAALSDAHGGKERLAGLLDGSSPADGSPQAVALATGRAQIGVLDGHADLPWPE